MKKLLFALICLLFICPVMAQDTSLVSGLEDENAVEKITGTFKSTRVINAHSTEMLYKGNMDFRILHRFGPVNSGVKEFFGLDNANMRMSFDFGITNNLMIGIGRSTNLKDLDFLYELNDLINIPTSLQEINIGNNKLNDNGFPSRGEILQQEVPVQLQQSEQTDVCTEHFL